MNIKWPCNITINLKAMFDKDRARQKKARDLFDGRPRAFCRCFKNAVNVGYLF